MPDGDFQGHQHCSNSFWHYANTRTIHLLRNLTVSRFIDSGVICEPRTKFGPVTQETREPGTLGRRLSKLKVATFVSGNALLH